MKITARQYAQALADVLENADEQSGKAIIRRFVETVSGKRQSKLFGLIIRNLSEICRKKEGKIEAEITSAFPLSEKGREVVLDFLAKNFSKDKADISVKEKIDPEVIGGVVVSSEGCVWDMSVSGGIGQLKRAIK